MAVIVKRFAMHQKDCLITTRIVVLSQQKIRYFCTKCPDMFNCFTCVQYNVGWGSHECLAKWHLKAHKYDRHKNGQTDDQMDGPYNDNICRNSLKRCQLKLM